MIGEYVTKEFGANSTSQLQNLEQKTYSEKFYKYVEHNKNKLHR